MKEKNIINHDRALELLNAVINQMCEEEGENGNRVCEKLAELGFTKDELVVLGFNADKAEECVCVR